MTWKEDVPKFSWFIRISVAAAIKPTTAGRIDNGCITNVCGRVDADWTGSHLAYCYNVGKFWRRKPLMPCNDFALYHGNHRVTASEAEESDFKECVK